MIAQVMDGMRAISHIYIVLYHYFGIFLSGGEVQNIPVPIKHLFRLSLMIVFAIFFVINGYNSGRWLIRSISSNGSHVRVSIKFLMDRLAMIIAITYLFYLCFSLFAFFIVKDSALDKVVTCGLLANLFFVSNYTTENNVRSFYYFVIPILILPFIQAHSVLWTYYVFVQLTLITPPIMIIIKRYG